MGIVGKLEVDPKSRFAFIGIKTIIAQSKSSIRKGWYFVGKELQKEGQKLVKEGPKTGRLYRIKGRRRRHRASAPGEPPANRFGDLRRSINFKVEGWRRMAYGAGTTTMIYPAVLELGTRKSRKIEKRPYLIVAIKTKQKQTRKIFEQQLKKGLNR